MYRISGEQSGFDADTIEQARERLRNAEPGRYHVDEIRAEPFPSGRRSRVWGTVVRHADGRIDDDRILGGIPHSIYARTRAVNTALLNRVRQLSELTNGTHGLFRYSLYGVTSSWAIVFAIAMIVLACGGIAAIGQLVIAFGLLNALFTALAFAGVVYTMLLQHQTRAQQNQLEHQKQDSLRQSREQYFAARLNAQVALMQVEDALNKLPPDPTTTEGLRHEQRMLDLKRAKLKIELLAIESELVYPGYSHGPPPVDGMPDDVRADYDEARSLASLSPRSAAALLRLAVQKLCKDLGERGENINHDIGQLVKKGLPSDVQKALDIVRVIGNNAVHPGELDIRDTPEVCVQLFGLINMIVERMIIVPKKLDELFSSLPQGTLRAIDNRDSS
jgi:hypothetical protein